MRRKPYSVLLLDEIEKAHPDVFNILLQILEDGRLTDAQGRTVDFRNAIVIMTSNIGASEISKNTSIGFTVSDETGMSYDDMKNRIMGDLKKVFRPEFLNRIDEVIVFHKLAKEEVKEIIDLMINRVRVQVAEHELQLELTENAKDILVDKGWDPSMGARPLRRAIQRYIEDPLADEVLRQGEMVPGSTVMVERDESGDEEDKPLKLRIIEPKKPPKPKAQSRAREGRRRRQVRRRREPARATSRAAEAGDAGARATTPERRPRGPIGLRFRHERARPDGDRHLERRSLPALRRDDRRGAPGSAAAARAAASTPSSPPTPTGRARPTRCSAGRWRASRARTTAWSAPSATTSTRASATARAGFPRFTDPAPARARTPTPRYLRMAAERSLERLGASSFDLLLLHNPDRIGYTSEAVWDGMAALREAGLTARIGVAPGPANGFTLDLISCLERFGERIDWAMIILNPFEPWPGELCLDAAARRRGQGDHPGRRLRRPLLGRPAARHGAGRRATTAPSARRAGSRPGWRSSSGSCRSPSGRG